MLFFPLHFIRHFLRIIELCQYASFAMKRCYQLYYAEYTVAPLHTRYATMLLFTPLPASITRLLFIIIA